MTPARFREELKRFDRTLDFEWNGHKGQWEIIGTDRKNKKYLIKKFPLGTIDTIGLHTIQELYDVSPLHQGGAKKMNARIDELIRQEEEANAKADKEKVEERLDDAWMHYQYKEGTRVALSSPTKQETVVITDRRRTVHDTP